ncbi:hypothetical protein BpHYR1_036608 [Brachionus plicatilis]|uniref:Uncharacterized protein n=1 Tax=Brachionus plicatilis TaxID=10195 RepID=A0A3M7T3A4_BRAPC|nr:hypothetical protein BpHYR1_036608 [Brachionus plicatilis]
MNHQIGALPKFGLYYKYNEIFSIIGSTYRFENFQKKKVEKSNNITFAGLPFFLTHNLAALVQTGTLYSFKR